MSSSLFPLNMTPQITSTQPLSGLAKKPSGLTTLRRRYEDDPGGVDHVRPETGPGADHPRAAAVVQR